MEKAKPVKKEKIIMPIIFIGHGSPMNAVEDNEFTSEWKKIATRIPKPKAILCISAHWVTSGTSITDMEQPKTIHDFYGFPKSLYEITYPAKGSPEYAEKIRQKLKNVDAILDAEWGLDHGTWSVLRVMYPAADIPVVQLSVDENISMESHFKIGKELSRFRKEGVLIIGSGNIVHNLGMMNPKGLPYEWAVNFDAFVKNSIEKNDYPSIINFKRNENAMIAHPSDEHFIPLLYVLGAAQGEKAEFSCDKIFYASLSMRCVAFGLTNNLQ